MLSAETLGIFDLFCPCNLFSTDLELDWKNNIDYYHTRFQIEFNFRDAKQRWAIEDFMVVKEQSLLNAANLSFNILLINPDFSKDKKNGKELDRKKYI
ncbi:hypothetical protein [Desulfobacter postgatei]|uniref:hypothetical protein n=1 Tax=Desulfobacter postgatei TaxID=2293 RepID=UPI003A521D53